MANTDVEERYEIDILEASQDHRQLIDRLSAVTAQLDEMCSGPIELELFSQLWALRGEISFAVDALYVRQQAAQNTLTYQLGESI